MLRAQEGGGGKGESCTLHARTARTISGGGAPGGSRTGARHSRNESCGEQELRIRRHARIPAQITHARRSAIAASTRTHARARAHTQKDHGSHPSRLTTRTYTHTHMRTGHERAGTPPPPPTRAHTPCSCSARDSRSAPTTPRARASPPPRPPSRAPRRDPHACALYDPCAAARGGGGEREGARARRPGAVRRACLDHAGGRREGIV